MQSGAAFFPVALSRLVVLIIFLYYMWLWEESSVLPLTPPSLISLWILTSYEIYYLQILSLILCCSFYSVATQDFKMLMNSTLFFHLLPVPLVSF